MTQTNEYDQFQPQPNKDGEFPTPLEGALFMALNYGVPQTPLKGKVAFLPQWQLSASADPRIIQSWFDSYKCNFGSMSVLGSHFAFESDLPADGTPKIRDRFKSQGGDFTSHLVIESSPGKGHRYYASAPGVDNIAQGVTKYADFSVRAKAQYCVSPGSVHPVTQKQYRVVMHNGPLTPPTPEEIAFWKSEVITEVKSPAPAPAAALEQKDDQPFQSNAPEWVRNVKAKDGDFDAVLDIVPVVHEGGRNTTLASVLGKLHQSKWTNENVLEAGQRINQKFQPPLSDTEVKTVATSVCLYPVKLVGSETVQMSQTEATRVAAEDAKKAQMDKDASAAAFILANYPGPNMTPRRATQIAARIRVQAAEPESKPGNGVANISSTAFTSTVLSDIYVEHFEPNDWPLVLALPALVTAASAVVPLQPRPKNGMMIGEDPMATLYTALIGEVNAGKSQMINWAARAIGIMPEDEVLGTHFYAGKWGSGEQLLKALQKKQSNFVSRSALIVSDELSHLFAKATMEKASLPMILDTAFYKRHHNFTLGGQGGGTEYNLNLAMSLIGGVVESEFDTVFGAGTIGGLYDRFLFGRAPEGFKWDYRQCPIISNKQWSTWGMTSVIQDPSIWEVTKGWKKKNPDLGRVSELCVRVATIFASCDGRTKLTGADVEALLPLAQYQMGIRSKFAPNEGVTYDAVFGNKAMDWISSQGTGWLSLADLKHALYRTIKKVGPSVAMRGLRALACNGDIDIWEKDRAGKMPPPDDYTGPEIRVGIVRKAF